MHEKPIGHLIGVVALTSILSGCVIRAEPATVYYEPTPVYEGGTRLQFSANEKSARPLAATW